MVWYISLVQLFNVQIVTKYQTSNFKVKNWKKGKKFEHSIASHSLGVEEKTTQRGG